GYRYYDKKAIEPLFPFGYGLSYTTFTYSNLRLSASEIDAGEALRVSVDVQNTGTRAGKEVVQLYVSDPEASVLRPPKELKRFQKVSLEPGETKTVTFTLDQRALSFFDPMRKAWVAEAGEFEVLVGSSSRDIRERATFTLKATAVAPITDQSARERSLSIDTPLGDLLADERVKAVLEKHLGPVLKSPQISGALQFSLRTLAGFVPQILTPELLEAIEADLAAL
ncbi:MAG: fibronectin type III-like domain-contianing protein, partial [Anaerolineae bacterium]|nr:fibronectin type III-like domain-contianing protein [Anaerolineae bacterium]